MTLCGDMTVGKDMGLCKVMAVDTPSQEDLFARKAALLPRNLARFRAESPRQTSFRAQKCAGTYFVLGKPGNRSKIFESLGDKRERDGAPARDRRNGLKNHEAAATRRADQQCPPRRGRAFVAERLPRAGQSARKGWADKGLCRRLASFENPRHGDAARRGYPQKPPRSRFRALSGGHPQTQRSFGMLQDRRPDRLSDAGGLPRYRPLQRAQRLYETWRAGRREIPRPCRARHLQGFSRLSA